MPSKLEIHKATLAEIRDRRQKIIEHLRDANEKAEYYWTRYIEGAGSQHEARNKHYRIEARGLQHALDVKIPQAFEETYAKWIQEYWRLHGKIALPREITSGIQESLGSPYVFQIQRQVEAQLATRKQEAKRT
ncbi:hypothetical protein F4811DRAFT_553608 [Daldinia bambusicola]|nr:hypothetical protein F4811DRAFT_553608 [Daldinia bambusicola]